MILFDNVPNLCETTASMTHMLTDDAQADDELDAPYLAGFEWDPQECYTRFIVHQKKTGEAQANTSSKKKNKKKDEE